MLVKVLRFKKVLTSASALNPNLIVWTGNVPAPFPRSKEKKKKERKKEEEKKKPMNWNLLRMEGPQGK